MKADIASTDPLSAAERATLSALLERLFPALPDGTGVVTLGVADYIGTALAGPYRDDADAYRAILAALDRAAGGGFAGAPADRQDGIVAALERGDLAGLPHSPDRPPFEMIWRHMREGLFSDPAHGGNRDMGGWRLIGFPGARFGYRAEEQALDHRIDREPASLRDLPQAARTDDRARPARGPIPSKADIVIVGGGAVGGFLAHALVRGGREVVVLEAGPARSGHEHVMDELSATAFRNLGGAAKFNDEVPTWRLNPGAPSRRATMSQGLETALGGNSIAWGAVAMRFYEDDFRIRSATVARHGEESIPAESTLIDWPLSYAELEPFYDVAERLLGVSGKTGNLGGRVLAGGNPYEAPRAAPYAMPPLRTSGLGALFAEAATAEGYAPFPLPAAIATTPWNGRHACTYCSFCSRFGCHVDAKASIQNTVLPGLLDDDRFALFTGTRALAVETDTAGKATGVRYVRAGGEEGFIAAETVVLAGYAFENTRLLLLSKGARHPDGAGNSAGQVGRHFITRQQPSVYGIFDDRRLNRFVGPTAQAMAIADLSADHFDHDGLGFIRGGRIACFNQFLPIEGSGVAPPDTPRWGAAWRDHVIHAWNRTAMLFIDPEILPYANNRLDLDPTVTDPLGRPVTRITFDIGDNERKLIPFLQDRAEAIARRMGASRIWRRPMLTGPISTHDVGGARMGDDPATSVVDSYGAVHDTLGLYVIGASMFASLPAVNPALTVVALALRAGARMGGITAEALAP